jgi:hypothetical protein
VTLYEIHGGRIGGFSADYHSMIGSCWCHRPPLIRQRIITTFISDPALGWSQNDVVIIYYYFLYGFLYFSVNLLLYKPTIHTYKWFSFLFVFCGQS